MREFRDVKEDKIEQNKENNKDSNLTIPGQREKVKDALKKIENSLMPKK